MSFVSLSQSFARIAKSTCIITCALLLIADLSIAWLNPLKRLNETGFTGLNQYYVVAKLNDFLVSKNNPDVLLTGSSLWLYPSVRCDDELAGRRTRYDVAYVRDHIDGYVYSNFFNKLLNDTSGKKLEVTNLGTAGGLMSDQYVLLKKTVAACKKPKLVICDISPREFLDNNQPDPTKTPVFIVMSDFTGFKDLLRRSANFGEMCEFAVGAGWNYFRSRRDFRLFFANLVAAVTGNPPDMAQSQNNWAENHKDDLRKLKDRILLSKNTEVPVFEHHAPYEEDLANYKKVYTPVNKQILETQLDYFRQFLELAKREQIPVICAQMPLTERNVRLLPADDYIRLMQTARQFAAQYGAQYFVPTKHYLDSDFEDSAHLNATGGKKFFAELSDFVAKQL